VGVRTPKERCEDEFPLEGGKGIGSIRRKDVGKEGDQFSLWERTGQGGKQRHIGTSGQLSDGVKWDQPRVILKKPRNINGGGGEEKTRKNQGAQQARQPEPRDDYTNQKTRGAADCGGKWNRKARRKRAHTISHTDAKDRKKINQGRGDNRTFPFVTGRPRREKQKNQRRKNNKLSIPKA